MDKVLQWAQKSNIDVFAAIVVVAGALSAVLSHCWVRVTWLFGPWNGLLRFTFCPSRFQAEAKRRGISLSTFVMAFVNGGVDHENEIIDELTEADIDQYGQCGLSPDQKSRLYSWLAQLKKEDEKKTVFRLLVMGETSDGKSTVVNKLLGRSKTGPCHAGANVRGTTKLVRAYVVRKSCIDTRFPGTKLIVYDCPGLGDYDVGPHMLLDQISAMQDENGGQTFDGLLMVSKSTDEALKIGPRIMTQILDCAFNASSKWDCVVFVGTHADKASQTMKESFCTAKLDLLNEAQKSSIKRACVIDCRPLTDNRKSPNLGPLWDNIYGLIHAKMEAEADRKMHAHLGYVRHDQDIKDELLKRLAPILDESQKEILDRWDRQYQYEKERRVAAVQAQMRAEAALEAKEEEFQKERKQLQEDMSDKLAQHRAGALIGKDVLVQEAISYYYFSTRGQRYIKARVTGMDSLKRTTGIDTDNFDNFVFTVQQSDGVVKKSMRRKEFLIFGVDVIPIWYSVGSGRCNPDGEAISRHSVPLNMVYVDPDAGNLVHRRSNIYCQDTFKTSIELAVSGSMHNTLICKRTDKPNVSWDMLLEIQVWQRVTSLPATAGEPFGR